MFKIDDPRTASQQVKVDADKTVHLCMMSFYATLLVCWYYILIHIKEAAVTVQRELTNMWHERPPEEKQAPSK